MLQELLRERQELEAELAAKTRQQEEAEVMERQVAALLQDRNELAFTFTQSTFQL